MKKNDISLLVPFFVLIALFTYSFYDFSGSKPEMPMDPSKFPHVSYARPTRGIASSPEKRARTGTVLYKLKNKRSERQERDFQEFGRRFSMRTEKKFRNGRTHRSKHKMESVDPETVAKELIATGAVEFAEPDYVVELAYAPNDMYISSQWHHTKIKSNAAWDVVRGQANVLIASCDTGVQADHPDLTGLLLPEYNQPEQRVSYTPPLNPHGTMTTGAMAAAINNQVGIAGVGGGVKILPIRVSNSEDGASTFSDLAGCIEYAADQGAKVVNLSYSGADSATIDDAAKYLRSKGGLLVMAAGNDGMDVSVNSDYSSFLIIGATDSNDERPSWSNYGTPVDMVAPGLDIFTTNSDSSYAVVSGTSLATPLVSGAAALIYSLNNSFTPAQVENFLLTTAKATRRGTAQDGYGVLDAEAAVNAARATLPAPSTTTSTTVSTTTTTTSTTTTTVRATTTTTTLKATTTTTTIKPTTTTTTVKVTTTTTTLKPTTTTLAALKTVKFNPIEDTNVKATEPTHSFGSATSLQVMSQPEMYAFFKFEVKGVGTIKSVKLRFYASNGTNNGPKVFASTNSWSGSTTWKTKPALNATALADFAGRVNPGAYFEYDLTGKIKANGIYTLVLKGDSTDPVIVTSKEGGSKPELVINYQ